MDHGADVRHGHVVDQVVLAGFLVDLDFSEAGDERVGRAVALVVVATDAHETLSGQARRALRERVDVLGHLVAVEMPPSSIAFLATCASVIPAPPPLRCTRSLSST